MKHKALVPIVILLTTITIGVLHARHSGVIPAPLTEAATRGDIVNVVAATGTVNAVTTVEVGSEITGTIESLGADFNDIVHKGQVLAKLDPSVYQSTLEQARGALGSAQADAQRSRVDQAGTDRELTRARELHDQQLMTDEDFQTAETASRFAAAQVASADAAVREAQSAVQTAQVNLSKTIIDSPIDGVVVSRNVDVGQTVSANTSAPTLFILAADLSKMQVAAGIDESDVGRVEQGQAVTFHVDAFMDKAFTGKVLQVRLNPTVDSNVVTYTAIVDAPNPRFELKPGMTATVAIVVGRHDDVLRVPASALKFRPTPAVLARFSAKNVAVPGSKSNTVWISNGKTISPVTVSVGATDGVLTELVSAPFSEGTRVVTHMSNSVAP